ncbi:MAG: phosphotransferase [Deltaproteobacteria bacterium]|jgi:homoserine kinase type II|nr:phosphotransferase [Deltaproteobacteria bacterium]
MIENAIDIFKTHYDLGDVIEAKELTGGYNNHSFALTTRRNDHQVRYVVRRYNPRTAEKEVKFEHALVNHLCDNGFDLAAGILPATGGDTYVKEKQTTAGQTTVIYWAVFEYLQGEERYTWTDTDIAPDDLTSAARVLARLHQAGSNFRKPPGADRVQPAIMDFLPTFGETYAQYAQKAAKTEFDQLFQEQKDNILEAVDKAILPVSDRKKLPWLPIHCDFHQGNMKYKNSEVTGLFDFDWSKIDLRVFDVGLALVYFCARWEGRTAGSLDLDQCELFLKTYNQAWTPHFDTGPVSRLEKQYLPAMLAAGNLFVLHWTIFDYYTLESWVTSAVFSGRMPDVELYMKFLNHGLNLMNWIEDRKATLAGL